MLNNILSRDSQGLDNSHTWYYDDTQNPLMGLWWDSKCDKNHVLFSTKLKYFHHFLVKSMQYFDGTQIIGGFRIFLVKPVYGSGDLLIVFYGTLVWLLMKLLVKILMRLLIKLLMKPRKDYGNTLNIFNKTQERLKSFLMVLV